MTKTVEIRSLELEKAKRGEVNAEEKLAEKNSEHVETEKLIERRRSELDRICKEKHSVFDKMKQMESEERRLQLEIEGNTRQSSQTFTDFCSKLSENQWKKGLQNTYYE